MMDEQSYHLSLGAASRLSNFFFTGVHIFWSDTDDSWASDYDSHGKGATET